MILFNKDTLARTKRPSGKMQKSSRDNCVIIVIDGILPITIYCPIKRPRTDFVMNVFPETLPPFFIDEQMYKLYMYVQSIKGHSVEEKQQLILRPYLSN